MSKQRRNFSAKFKSDLVIELLKGEKDLNTLAVENNIQPNLLRNWKKEFLSNASVVFDDKREDNLKEKLAEERKEKAEYAKKVVALLKQKCYNNIYVTKLGWYSLWQSVNNIWHFLSQFAL